MIAAWNIIWHVIPHFMDVLKTLCKIYKVFKAFHDYKCMHAVLSFTCAHQAHLLWEGVEWMGSRLRIALDLSICSSCWQSVGEPNGDEDDQLHAEVWLRVPWQQRSSGDHTSHWQMLSVCTGLHLSKMPLLPSFFNSLLDSVTQLYCTL